jgi:ABC-2 type transport system permease protein
VAPAVTLVAFAVLPLTAAQFGVLPVLVAVPAALLELVMVVLLSRVVAAGLAATMSSRRGQELGGLLMAVVIALASGGWSLATVIGQQLAAATSPGLGTALRVLPSGWGAVAVAAADRSDWPVVVAALTGLAVLSVLLLGAWARLLPVTMRRSGGRASRARSATATGQPAAWERLLPAGPTGAVVAKELRAWRRDPGRSLLLLLALLISGLNLAVPALAFHLPAGLPWVGLAAARSALWTVGILLVPQGLVAIGFNLFGVDQQVKVWFAARYLPQDRQPLPRPASSPRACSPSGGPWPSDPR